jgi:hypothetical protein
MMFSVTNNPPDYRADDVLKILTTGQMMFSGTNNPSVVNSKGTKWHILEKKITSLS